RSPTTWSIRWSGRFAPGGEAEPGNRKMFKIGQAPTPRADSVEHADYLEIECLRRSDARVSGADLAAALGRLDDDLLEEKPKSDTGWNRSRKTPFPSLRSGPRTAGRDDTVTPSASTKEPSC